MSIRNVTPRLIYGFASPFPTHPRDEVLDMIEDHVTNAVVEIPAAGESGRGALFRQVRKLPVPRYQPPFSIKSRNRREIVVIRVKPEILMMML